MEKLTKLKNVFSKENIKKGVRIGVLTAGMAFTAMGLTSCGLKPCLDEECIYYEQEVPKDHTHDYCEEVGCDGKEHKGQDHDDYYNSGTEQGGTENGGTEQGGTEQGGTEQGGTENGGTEQGGTENGGTEQGGTEQGGTEQGGTENGGTEQGGTENGGTEQGGTENGGTEQGGTEQGGTENGGTENGGTTGGTGTEGGNETTWYDEKHIGGEDSPYKVFVIDNNAYNNNEETKNFTAESKVNDYLDKYIEHINGLTLNKELTGDVEIPTTAIKNMVGDNAEWRFDALIGTTSKNEISTNTIGINDVCKPAIEKFAEKICTNATNKTLFKLYYKAISNEAYRSGYNGEITDKKECVGGETEMEQKYIQTKKDCSIHDGKPNIPFEYKYFYLENGELNPEVVQQFDTMITTAANELNINPDDARNLIKLSLTASSIEGMHDYLSSTLLVNEHTHTDACYNNEMYDAIDKTTIAQAKLNKSIFSQDYGRELV